MRTPFRSLGRSLSRSRNLHVGIQKPSLSFGESHAKWPFNSAMPPSKDFTDGRGISHARKVRSDRTLNPWEATVYWVNYGCRYNADGCVTNTRWRHNGIEYEWWDGSRWVVVESVSAGPWVKTGNNPSLAYDSHYQTVDLERGALVLDKYGTSITTSAFSAVST